MDSFLREINSETFKQWVLSQSNDEYEVRIDSNNANKIIIETMHAFGEIGFYPMEIIELSVVNKFSMKQEFYLHFQMNTMKHAMDLFNEMVDCILSIGDDNAVKVLLCCSGGLTTGYFANLLNEKIELFNYNYEFNATSITKAMNEGSQYDVILLAPQIGYKRDELKNLFKDKIVLAIPTAVFGKYDAVEMISEIHYELVKREEEKEKAKKEISLKQNLEYEGQVLVVAGFETPDRARIFTRIYDQDNVVIFDKETIKNKLDLEDLSDTIDMVTLDFPEISMIGIAMPGIANNGKLTLPHKGYHNVDVKRMFEAKYNKKVVLSNDVNSIAVGYYASQEDHQSLSFIYQQPGQNPGLGTIIDGKLIVGKSSLAGELKYLPFNPRSEIIDLSRSKEGMIELVVKYILSIMCICDPELVIIYSPMVDDVNAITNKIYQYVDPGYVPEILIAEELQEYILLGQMILTVESDS